MYVTSFILLFVALSFTQETAAAGGNNLKSLEAPIGDLKLYKVLGVVSSVILALNTGNDTPYIIKVLFKCIIHHSYAKQFFFKSLL